MNKIKLTDSEWKVMALLWEKAPRTITELTKAFNDTTGWTKHTIMTFLRRMEEKSAIHYEEGARAKLYYPDIVKEKAELQEAGEFLEKVFNGSMGMMVSAMVQQKALSKEEIDALYEILIQAELQK